MSVVTEFIGRWSKSGAAERSNYALFISELCDLLEVQRPDPSSEYQEKNNYVFDRSFTRTTKDGDNSTVYLDLYKRGHFVLETKQGSIDGGGKVGHGKRGTKGWDKALDKAYHQARAYIGDLPSDHGRPPFLIVVDVGHCFDLYAEFSGTGGNYLAFPTPAKRRIFLEDLEQEETRALLKTIWSDPESLDPSKHSAKVTRQVSETLAKLATALEREQHAPQEIATFLQRILFTLFAEDVGLLPLKCFEQLLEKMVDTPQGFSKMVTTLWQEMATGTDFSTIIMQSIKHFNGGLFDNPSCFNLTQQQIQLILDAARQDWKDVEPAIFGTLLERALDPTERHKLGAHYTPRSYVERLIEPTMMRPLRDEWTAVRTAAALHHEQGQHSKARKEIEKYHQKLCEVKILDPACGSGNFLYIALAKLKELEAEVLNLLDELGGDRTLEMDSFKVRPDQFLGLEINERACAIAQLVIWIGYFQWHHKTTGKADTNDRPLLNKQNTILNQDAVLEYDERIPRTDSGTGEPITIWDGRTTKPHPVTGNEVPDESARKPLYDYINPRRTIWPNSDFIVGNPPFLGASRMRDSLGDGYTEGLRKAWKQHKPDSWDFVMYWWHQAAEMVRDTPTVSLGFITTNSISQTLNRRCIEPFLTNDKKPLSITFAIPDHPWVDAAECAAVRIAMTSVTQTKSLGLLTEVISESPTANGENDILIRRKRSLISAKLTTGVNVTKAHELKSNSDISSMGMKLHGQGFFVESDLPTPLKNSPLIKRFIGSTDVVQRDRNRLVIDAYGETEKSLRENHPAVYQYLSNSVKSERDAKAHTKDGAEYAKKWWAYGKPRQNFRKASTDIKSFLVTPRTAKHRIFTTFNKSCIPESELICIALFGDENIAILSSIIHSVWAINLGSYLGPTPRYNNSRCFETFPFPIIEGKATLMKKLKEIGGNLDAHRRSRQSECTDLTLTSMYNVLEKIRKDEELTEKDKVIHNQGLVTILKQNHDDIDTAVLESYGWSDLETDLPLADRLAQGDDELEQSILQRLIDLNHERATEEAQGHIRYLRPEFQNPSGATETKSTLKATETQKKATVTAVKKLKWPKSLPERVTQIKDLVPIHGTDSTRLSLLFGRTSKKREQEIQDILQTLQQLGQIQ